MNSNEYTTHSKLWDTKKMFLIDKLIVLITYIKTLKRLNTRNLAAHMKTIKQETIPQSSRVQEIIKLGVEINK